MPQTTLLRHGQANSAAQDEASYDKLSELGHQQAQWLGVHLTDHAVDFDHVIQGTLQRHRETASSMQAQKHTDITEDARLNELEYFGSSTFRVD